MIKYELPDTKNNLTLSSCRSIRVVIGSVLAREENQDIDISYGLAKYD